MSDRESFKEWYDTIWLGDNEHGQFIPESNHVDYKEYLQGYTLAHGAWQARQAEITQLRQQLAEANKDAERAWLVEKDINGFPNYLYCDFIGLLVWTPSNAKALRFSRKIDAESLCSIVENADRVAEHMWTDQVMQANNNGEG